jgi:hypothetical protein
MTSSVPRVPALALALAPWGAWEAAEIHSGQETSVEDCVRLALAVSPELLAAQDRIRAAAVRDENESKLT